MDVRIDIINMVLKNSFIIYFKCALFVEYERRCDICTSTLEITKCASSITSFLKEYALIT